MCFLICFDSIDSSMCFIYGMDVQIIKGSFRERNVFFDCEWVRMNR